MIFFYFLPKTIIPLNNDKNSTLPPNFKLGSEIFQFTKQFTIETDIDINRYLFSSRMRYDFDLNSTNEDSNVTIVQGWDGKENIFFLPPAKLDSIIQKIDSELVHYTKVYRSSPSTNAIATVLLDIKNAFLYATNRDHYIFYQSFLPQFESE
jgi:hypothetical protein